MKYDAAFFLNRPVDGAARRRISFVVLILVLALCVWRVAFYVPAPGIALGLH